jgi:hypothetical protein
MPLTISNWTGDGVKDPIIATSIQLPDSGTSVIIDGAVTPTGGPAVTVTGSPLTAPAAPGSGSVYWIIQVNTSTGAATVKQSTVAMPAADSGNQIVFAQTLIPATTDEAANATDVTPDTT